MKTHDIFLDMLPSIDLHGDDKETARVEVNDFIKENKILKNSEILIIHGIGTGLLKETVHNTLSKNKDVTEYKIAPTNVGCTIVKIHINND